MSNFRLAGMSYPMFLLLLLVIALIIFLLVIEPRISKRKLVNKNEHGSSKFADMKEIQDNFTKESINNIKEAGLPIWYEKDKKIFKNVYFDNKSPHYLLIGSTGSGKSVTVSIPLAIHFATAKEKHSVVLTDPKGELFKSTGKIFKDNGYDVVTIDFRNPTKSDRINVMQPIIDNWKEHCHYDKNMIIFLSFFFKKNKISITKFYNNQKYQDKIKNDYVLEDYIVAAIKNNIGNIEKNIKSKKYFDNVELKEYCEKNPREFLDGKSNEELLNYIKENQNESAKYQAETNRLVIALANLIFTEKNTKDPFWINSSKQLFIGIAGIFLEDYKDGLIDENKINISSVKKFQNSSLIKENQVFLQRNLNLRKYGSLSKDYLTPILSSAENTYKSITAVFAEKMAIFDDLNVENITSVSEFSFSSVGTKPTALYIIVPDEDRAYFQLVTIILGMLIKDLTKFANLPINNGILPVKVEWILDEFANCPPLDAIETTVSVARSRGMRFFFFIQSFSQLDQVYGKETASIIIDNAALQYLKTNSVETAEVIAKKLGRSTVVTNSMSMSTDPFKIGANQTQSLMGKELLTATEIIGLRYKTIIFPIVGNPIFRDTYMYSDIYPEYKNCSVLERKTSVLKRLTENYYTVENLKEIYNKQSDNNTSMMTKKIEQSYQRQIKRDQKTILNNVAKENNQMIVLETILNTVRNVFKDKILEENQLNNVYTFEIDGIMNRFDRSKLEKAKNENVIYEIGKNIRSKKTILSFWLNESEKEMNL